MNTWIALSLILVILGFLLLVLIMRRQAARIKSLEKMVRNLTMGSGLFPEFLQRGEALTRTLADELALRQHAVGKLIDEAQKVSGKLQQLEAGLKESRMDQRKLQEILILYNQGFSSAQIAADLQLPAGEVELAIKLKQYLGTEDRETLSG